MKFTKEDILKAKVYTGDVPSNRDILLLSKVREFIQELKNRICSNPQTEETLVHLIDDLCGDILDDNVFFTEDDVMAREGYK